MAEYNREGILKELEVGVATEQGHPDAMPGDKWLLSSCWQKAVRRNHVGIAQRATSALWKIDRESLWRRIHIVCLEDIGAGDPETVVRVLTATAASAWRRKMGDERVALYLTRLMCGAVKNRMSDELYIQAERAPEYHALRQFLAKADNAHLISCSSDQSKPLIERALALWLLAGTKKYPSEAIPLRVGDPGKAIEVISGLDAPADLVASCIGVMNRTSWPLALLMPLIWQEVEKHKPSLSLQAERAASVPDVHGLRVYAADMFTRIGQSSIRQFQRAAPKMKGFSIRQIGLALFYAEGCKVDRLLTSALLEEFRKAGEVADIEGAGLFLPEYLGMKDTLIENIQTLHDIRYQQLKDHLAEESTWAI